MKKACDCRPFLFLKFTTNLVGAGLLAMNDYTVHLFVRGV